MLADNSLITKKQLREAVELVKSEVGGKADSDHTHDEYLTAIPEEYVTETELTDKGYATVIYVDEIVGDIEYLLAAI